MVTNFEYYSKFYPDVMIELLSNNRNHNMLAYHIGEDKPVACYNMGSYESCSHCKFSSGGSSMHCEEKIKQWLEAPYEGTDNTKGEITW